MIYQTGYHLIFLNIVQIKINMAKKEKMTNLQITKFFQMLIKS